MGAEISLDGRNSKLFFDRFVNAEAFCPFLVPVILPEETGKGMQRVLGAVANDVVHHAPCDVMVVKTV
jgi:hypothetical protein